jgi:hypothetical protein
MQKIPLDVIELVTISSGEGDYSGRFYTCLYIYKNEFLHTCFENTLFDGYDRTILLDLVAKVIILFDSC